MKVCDKNEKKNVFTLIKLKTFHENQEFKTTKNKFLELHIMNLKIH